MPDVKFDSIVGFLPVNIRLEQPEKDEIASCFEIRRLEKNDHFIKEGNHVRLIGGVIHGILYRYNYDRNDKLHIDQFITNDHFFTEYKCYKENLPSCFNIIAVTPCEIITISTTKLEALRKAGPGYNQCINETISESIDRRRNIDAMFQHGTKAELIDRFHGHYKPWGPYICNDLIANFLGMSRTQYYHIRNN